MEFKGCTVGGEIYRPEHMFDEDNPLIHNLQAGHKTAAEIREFLILISVCHTVIPDNSGDEELLYQAASPDERALVYGARRLGYVFQTRTPHHVIIKALDVEEKYEILNVLEFTSTRKRMSIIARTPEGKIKLYCKVSNNFLSNNAIIIIFDAIMQRTCLI